jgi:hypothetical protein
MKRRHAGLAAGGLVVAALGLVGILPGLDAKAHAEGDDDAATAAELVNPDIQRGGDVFYTEDQIEEAWSAVIENFPAELPDGYSFPDALPFTLTDEQPGESLFEAALVDMSAAQLWRCAWLESALFAPRASQSSEIELNQALELYSTLPSVEAFDLRGLTTSVLEDYAAEMGYESAVHALHGLDCRSMN